MYALLPIDTYANKGLLQIILTVCYSVVDYE